MFKNLVLYCSFLLSAVVCFGQVTNFKEKFELPEAVKETSGLLFFDGKIITHNDSGDDANLYEIDSLNGNLLRTVTIANATNIDWEDITQDDTHIYVGDIGNNNGNRSDLKIYKILKSEFQNSNAVNAEIISFTYEDQTDFTIKTNSNNFDAEALIIYHDQIYIFSKNWIDFKTRVYKLPTDAGNYSATKISVGNISGLITGATTSNNHIILCGYDIVSPFTIFISANRSPDDNVFSNGFEKYWLSSELGTGNQIEGITSFYHGRFYISREASNYQSFNFTQKLFEFTDERSQALSTKKNNPKSIGFFPNPTKDKLTITSQKPILSITIYSIIGEKIISFQNPQQEINLTGLSKGSYYAIVHFVDNQRRVKKLIKL